MPIYKGVCPIGGEILQNTDPRLKWTGVGQPIFHCPIHGVDVPVKEAEA